MVRDSFIAYMDHRTEQIRLVLLMDRDFKVKTFSLECFLLHFSFSTRYFAIIPSFYCTTFCEN